MASSGRKGTKRGKPTYAYAIIGVSLVLFLFGLVGWIFLNLQKTGNYFKENIQLHAYIYPTAKSEMIDSLRNYVDSLPYTVDVQYIDKDKAIERYNTENDTLWKTLAISNPLPESIDFFVKADYVNEDSLQMLENNLLTQFSSTVSEFQTPQETVANVSQFVKTTTVVLLIIAIVLSIFVIISIDTTIRLAMYSNRFLVKTMQMVGATRGFITRPLDGRAVINGLISSVIAIALLSGTIYAAEKYIPALKVIHDNMSIALIFAGITTLGILITLASTHRSAIKYLRMKLDDLY